MTDSKVTLTAELLDAIEANCGALARMGKQISLSTDNVRALIDAARLCDELRREQESVAWQHVTRPAAFALVERELHTVRANLIEIEVRTGGGTCVALEYGDARVMRSSLLEAVDAAKAVRDVR